MEVSGEKQLTLPQQQVWEGLNDPQTLKAAIPGCESIERLADNEYKIALKAVVGPVKARFQGTLRMSDVIPPQSYNLAFEGSGGAAGFCKGTAQVVLRAEEPGTHLTYRAQATIGGKLAQVGARLIDGVARRMAEEFFERFVQALPPVQTSQGAKAPIDLSPSHPKPSAMAGRGWLLAAAAVVILALAGWVWSLVT